MASDQESARDRCRLCGAACSEPTDESASEAAVNPDTDSEPDIDPDSEPEPEGPFCSSGCREVAAELGCPHGDDHIAEGHSVESGSNTAEAASTETTSAEHVRAFFRVDGMHSTLCESYLESIAERCEGVADAAASYVTETVQVDHDPDRVSAAELEDALSRTGYTAYRREEAAGGDDGGSVVSGGRSNDTSTTRRSREMRGMRKRRSEDVLEIRYIVGIVFGSFLLVPYVTVFYPVYLSRYTEYWLFAQYGETFASFDGMLFLPVFFVLTAAVLYLTGMPLLRGAYVSLKLRQPSTQLLAALTIVAAFCYGTLSFFEGRPEVYYDLTILVAATVMAAVFYEETVKRAALNRLTDLTVSQVDTARILESDGTTRAIPVADVAADDRLLVRAGERIPVDGRVAEGECTVDEAVVTGESLPISKAAGDEVIGGSVVTGDAAVVDVGDRTASSIERLTRTVWNLQSADHGVQRRADELAGIALPLVVVAAVVVGLAAVLLGSSGPAVASAVLLTVVVASPWALALATPCSIASSIRDALESGIVVFDESVFERLREVDCVVFDKTGTLTTGEMTVLEAEGPDELLRAAGTLERRAAHPAAAAIADAFADGIDEGGSDQTRADGGNEQARTDGGNERARTDGGIADEGPSETGDGPEEKSVKEFQRHATGVEGVVDGQRLVVGHPDFVRVAGCEFEADLERRIDDVRADGHLPVIVGRDGRAEGLVVVGDEPRAEWEDVVSALDARGVDVVVLTGDDESATARFRDQTGVSRVFSSVPPTGKTAAIRRLREDGCVAMVGDGTNDAPALAAADLGLSLGGGTALAADAADLAIVEDDLAAVERAFALARGARRRVMQNLGLALAYNAIVIPVALAGLLSPVVTTLALVLSAALIVGNSSRALLEEQFA
ncbi:heavy metal translocating P-type ATPase [Natronorubrum texcoconense]|uniref:ATPase, P-type (Transporting), HAD superfamily, subfamily IC/heavy metal translocating P-type ATPase n=1 Tax=Natronorubrum texcoconense TaxID=1095776 RepID=A0A1G9ER50_9EURY|nr:heavy metal translocating P-type ATPase [Natronorubrum texcoconense]SDK78558.1 ATPase, P-type (transporting), HAD superfamily, subfamily IC/heavy metal translocating P-type ATPase [Natronorubrum texcoconense]